MYGNHYAERSNRMADATDNADKRDEEQEVRDTDADAKDTEQAEKADEEQTVRDTDADTSAIDSRLDAMEDMIQRMSGTLSKMAASMSAVVGNGVIYDVDDTDASDDDGADSAKRDVLDLSIDDIR